MHTPEQIDGLGIAASGDPADPTAIGMLQDVTSLFKTFLLAETLVSLSRKAAVCPKTFTIRLKAMIDTRPRAFLTAVYRHSTFLPAWATTQTITTLEPRLPPEGNKSTAFPHEVTTHQIRLVMKKIERLKLRRSGSSTLRRAKTVTSPDDLKPTFRSALGTLLLKEGLARA
ncbi:MAG: hypothetical protein Q9183_006233 [Haloplaca sp. 2 TL-2023]